MRLTAIFLLLCLLVTVTASAADLEASQRQAYGIDALENAVPQDLQPYLHEDGSSFGQDMLSIVKNGLSHCGIYLGEALKAAAALLLIVLLFAVVQMLPNQLGFAAAAAGACAVIAVCAGNIKSMIGLGRDTIARYSEFSKLLIPTIAGAAAASGAPAGASALLAATTVVTDVMVSVQETYLAPLMGIYIAAAAGDAVTQSSALHGLTNAIGTVIKTALRVILFAFSAYLSITGIISGTVDAMSLKAAKMTVSTAVPVIGGMLSDASETVLVSAAFLRNSVGLFGMLSVMAIGILPFLQLGIQYLVLQLTAFLAGVISEGSLTKLLHAIASAMGYLLAMTGTCAVLVFVACICFMKVAAP